MVFALYDAPSGGNQIGPTLTRGVLLFNGLFTVSLDFGAASFNGAARWLDITVQSGAYAEDLAPRTQILPSPYALYAASAASVASGAVSSQGLALDSNSLTRVSGGVIAISNVLINTNPMVTNFFWVPLVSVNGVLQVGVGGIVFPDGTKQLTAANAEKGLTNFDIGGTYSFTVPFSVTQVYLEGWGAGGGGGGGTAYLYSPVGDSNVYFNTATGGGGGAGGYARKVITVVPRQTYTIEVGVGGVGGVSESSTSHTATAGGNGGDTTFSIGPGTNFFICNGGGGGYMGVAGSSGEGGGGGHGGQGDPQGPITSQGSQGGGGYAGPDFQVVGFGGSAALGTFQPAVSPQFGAGAPGGLGYPNDTDSFDGFGGNDGCMIIQW